MPLQVTLTFAFKGDETIELPDNATGLTVKEYIRDSIGLPVEQIKVVTTQASKVVKDDTLLNSDPQGRYLKLKVVSNEIGGCCACPSQL